MLIVTQVASVIDWEDSSSGSEGETDADEAWKTQPVPSMKELSARSSARSSIKGLQAAIAEGWLVQRARDMCSFAHDRHRQTAVAMAEKLPEGTIASMSLRVGSLIYHWLHFSLFRMSRSSSCYVMMIG